jgi:hypothetical protein
MDTKFKEIDTGRDLLNWLKELTQEELDYPIVDFTYDEIVDVQFVESNKKWLLR